MELVSLSSHTSTTAFEPKGEKSWSALPQDSGTVDTVSQRLPPPRLRPHPWRHPSLAVQRPALRHLYLRLDCLHHRGPRCGLRTVGLLLSVLSWSCPSDAGVRRWGLLTLPPAESAEHSLAGIPDPSRHGTDYSWISRAVHTPYDSRALLTDQIWSSAAPHVPQSMSASRASRGRGRGSTRFVVSRCSQPPSFAARAACWVGPGVLQCWCCRCGATLFSWSDCHLHRPALRHSLSLPTTHYSEVGLDRL